MKKAIYIVGIYLLIGCIWILYSSKLLYQVFENNTDLILSFEIYKGWFFVIVTAILLYALIYRELKKQNKIQQLLKRSNDQYIQFFEQHPTALFIIDIETGIITSCNEKAKTISGYSKEEIIGKKANKFIQLSEVELLVKLKAQVNKEILYFRTSTTLANGELRYIEVFSNKQPIDGKNYYLTAVYDITENMKNENMNTFIFDKGPAGIAAFDIDGTIIRANNVFSNFFNESKEEITNKKITQLHTTSLIDFTQTDEFDIVYNYSNGKVKWGHLILSDPIIDFGQNYRIGVLEDITTQKEYESTLKMFELVVEQSPSAIYVAKLDETIEYVNSKYTEITGYTRNEIIGSTVNLLGSYDQSHYSNMKKTILSGKVWKGEYLNRSKTGSLYWELGLIAPLTDSNGKIQKYIGIKENISPEKEIQLELILAKEQAERASSAKSDFLANLSHELRTPMNAIMGFTDLLTEMEMEASKLKMLTIMQQSERDLITLLNSLLHLSRIESGSIAIQEERFTVNSLFERVERNFNVLASKKGLKLTCEDKTGYIADFLGDRIKIEHIIDNLLDNAIKFTSQGTVTFSILLDYTSNEKVCLALNVSDTGIGIPVEIRERIFEKFEQGEHYLKKQYSGAGLGLAIVKQLTDFMGGNIKLESEPNVGSSFTVLIPIKSTINND